MTLGMKVDAVAGSNYGNFVGVFVGYAKDEIIGITFGLWNWVVRIGWIP